MKRKVTTTKTIFGIYVLILIWIVLFKTAFSFAEIQWLRIERSVNLIPFHYGTDVGSVHTRETILNTLVFVPLGLFCRVLNISGKKTVLYGYGSSFAFELCQFAFAIGASDITDIITNTLGTVVGVFLYALLRKIFHDKQRTDKIINVTATVALLLFAALTLLLFVANQS